MRVLQLHNQYRRPGGEDAVVDAEASLLRQAGHDVLTHTATNPMDWQQAALKFAVAPWNRHAAERVVEVAQRFQPDIAHVHNTWFTLTPASVAALHPLGVPVVMTLHNYRLICANSYLFRDGGPCEKCVGSHPWHGVRHRCYNHSAMASAQAAWTIASSHRRGTWQHDVDLFFALSRFARDRFVAGGLPANRIDIKPHFVADPGPRRQPPSASRQLVYVGRLAPEKGVDVLIDAIDRLDGLELAVIGDGDERTKLKRRAGPRVRFLGHLPPAQVRHAMLQARALAFPSLSYETFGLVMVEAMAAGLPVLASNLGGSPDLVRPEVGELVAPGDVDAWVTALRGLNDTRVDEQGANARQQWEKRFSPAAALPALEEGYRWALSQHQSGSTP